MHTPSVARLDQSDTMSALGHYQCMNDSRYSSSWNEAVVNHLRDRDDHWSVPETARAEYTKNFRVYTSFSQKALTKDRFVALHKRYRDLSKGGASREVKAFELAEYVLLLRMLSKKYTSSILTLTLQL